MRIPSLLLFMLLLLAASCTRNAFELNGKFSGGEASTLYFSWRAASDQQDFLASQAVPLTGAEFKLTGAVKRPSIIWIFSSGRQLLHAVYVERGDKLTLSGNYSEPALWLVEGNDVMEQTGKWQQENRSDLLAGNATAINAAVAKYVKANPGSRTALFLLLTRFDRGMDPKTFQTLLDSFSDADMKEQMLAAALEPQDAALMQLSPGREARLDSAASPARNSQDPYMP